jgi:cell division protein FtsB
MQQPHSYTGEEGQQKEKLQTKLDKLTAQKNAIEQKKGVFKMSDLQKYIDKRKSKDTEFSKGFDNGYTLLPVLIPKELFEPL